MTDIEIPADLDAAIAEAEAKAARLEAEAHDIHAKAGDRALKPGEQTRFDRLTAGAKAAQAEAHEFRVEKRRRSIADIEAQMATGNVRRLPGAPDFTPITTRGDAPHRYVEERGGFASLAPADRVACARAALEVSGVQERMVEAFEAGLADRGSRPFADPARALTMWRSSPAYTEAFAEKLRADQRGIPGRYTPEQTEALHEVYQLRDALQLGNDAGNLVPVNIDPMLVISGAGEGPQRLIDVANRKVIANNQFRGITAAQGSFSWDAELAEVSDDTPDPGQIDIDLHAARGFVTASWEIEQDTPMLASEVGRFLADGMAVLIDTALATGSGSGAPTGYITALDGTASEDTSPATAEDLSVADVYNTLASLPARHHANARWAMHVGTGLDLRQLMTAESSSAGLWVDHGAFAPQTLAGKSVVYNNGAPNSLDLDAGATAANTGVLTVGDWDKFYVVTHVAGTSISYLPMMVGTTSNRPTAQSGWFMFTRLGSDVVDNDAFRMQSVPTTA